MTASTSAAPLSQCLCGHMSAVYVAAAATVRRTGLPVASCASSSQPRHWRRFSQPPVTTSRRHITHCPTACRLPPAYHQPFSWFHPLAVSLVSRWHRSPWHADCSSCIPQAASHVASPGQVMLGCGRQSLCSDCGLHADTAAECRL